ncbi:MAG: hypothetical protein ACJAT2_003013 [Bacteriovoracaceae bacterium]|jgi:hypothetical protein
MKQFIAITFLLLSLFSCSDSGEVLITKPDSKEVSALKIELQELETALADDLIMGNSTSDEVSNIKDYLLLIRVLSIRLNEQPTDKMATTELFKILKKIEAFPFTPRDAGLFENLIFRLRVILATYSSIQGMDLAGLEWGLYNFKFARTLDPYKTIKMFEKSPIWKFGSGGGHNFAKVESRGVQADSWLFSPVLNLKGSNKHQFVLTHTVRNPEWENFKVLISTDYTGDDPELATWDEIVVKPTRNVARNQWVNLVTNSIDLSKYSGKEIVIGFKFMANEKSNSVWEILGLEIKGTGVAVSSTDLEISFETPSEGGE